MRRLNSCDIAKLFLLSAVFLFSACENFIAGNVLKDALEKEIEYNRASPTTVTVSARPETLAQIVPTVGDYPYKKGDPITLRFIASDGYMFKYWEANPSNIIHFDNEKEVSTVAKLTEYADKVNIYPVCVKRPEVISFEPRNSDGVHYKNSHIKIEFDQELSEENDFSQIAVTMNGNSVKDSFFAPEWDKVSKKILIRANTNLIDLKSETETINVKIPGTFYFIEDGQKVEMGKDKTFSYTINSSTNEKAEIYFELNDKESGSLTYNQKTDNKYNIGEKINMSYKPAGDWVFFGWNIENGENVVQLADDTELELKTTVEVLSQSVEPVKISPVTFKRPVASFSPEKTQTGVPKNSSISITFTKPLSMENDLSKITITMGNESVLEHFENPEWVENGKEILFQANNDNPIGYTGIDTASIVVKVPADFYYEENGYKICFSEVQSYEYKINSKTNVTTKINFLLDDASSGKLTPSSQSEYYLGDKIQVRFTPDSDWQFAGWKCSGGSGVIQLTETGDYTAEIQVLKPSTEVVDVSPVVYKRLRLNLNASLPENLPNGVPKNSKIVLNFTEPLPESSEISALIEKISVKAGEEDLMEGGCFWTPEVSRTDRREVVIDATKKYIELTSGTRTVTVTVPAELYYETDEKKIYAGENLSFSYRVNPETNEKTFINFSFFNEYSKSGELDPVGIHPYNLFEYKAVNFVMDTDTYRFIKWYCSDEDAVELITNGVGVGYDNKGFNASTGVATAYFRTHEPANENNPVVITPVVEEIPTMNIYAESRYGRFSQSISGSYKEGTVIPLNFTSDSDYQFIKWQVKDRSTKTEIDNWSEDSGGYIKIDDLENANTSFTLKTAGSDVDLLIEPLCAKRPKVVSYSPQYSTEGDLRDRTLVVMFSTKMDESSIYYSGSELVELGVVNKNGSNYVAKSGYTLLGSLVDGDCYGYYENSDPDNSIVFKNIRICRLNNQDVNLLKYFEKPVFDKGNTGTLRIPTKITDLTNPDLSKRKDEAPPKNCEILVTLENGINYKNNKSNVSLSEEFSWAYYTNTGTDAEPPEFSSIEIKKENNVSLLEFTDVEHSLIENTDNIKTYNAKNGKIVFNLEVKDSGSGVGSVFATFTKINNEYYPTASGEDEIMETPVRFKLTGDKVSGSNNNKKLEEEIDLKDYGLDEGFYTVSLEAIDKNEHRAESKAFQFVYDNVPPKKVDNVPEIRLAEEETNLFWTKPEESDFAGVKVVSTNEDEAETRAPVIFARDSVPDVLTVKQLSSYKHYSHKIILSDYAGNETEIDVKKDEDAPSTVDFSESRTTASESIISWSGVADDVGKLLVECYKDDSLHDEQVVDRNKTSVNFKNLERGKKYKYKVTSYDYSGNPSKTVFKQDDEGPAAATITGNTRTCPDKETITWTNSSSKDFDYVIVEQYDDDGETPKNSFKSMDNKDILLNEFTDLTNQTKYTYKITAVDYSGNQTVSDPYVDNAGPTLLIQNRDNIIRNSRTSPGEETITWNTDALITNENQETDVDHVIVERWYSDSKKESFDDTGKTTTNTFTGLTNQEKYEYRFYSVDYSGNKSESYTTYLDGDGPDALVIRDNISNSRTSADEETITWTSDYLAGTDIDHIEIDQYEDTSLIRTFTLSSASSDTVTFEGLKNQHKYKYWFYSVDYSGNRSANYTEYEDNNGPESNVDIGIISNSRTSAETESVSWSADPTGNDIGGVLIKQYAYNKDGTTTYKQSFTQEINSTKTASFDRLENQTKYKYRFYSLDYSGNPSLNYTEYQDDVGPTSLVVKGNISNSRKKAETESVSWSANPTGSDVGGICIEQYDGSIRNNTVTYKVGSTKTANFAGMINQHKYKYRFYSLDYSGNKSTNYIEYQDDTPPAPLKIRYSEGRDGRVNVFFTTPSDEDYYITKGSWTIDGDRWDIDETKGINNSSYKTFKNGVNWTLYNYYFRTYDYSGNCSAYVHLEEVAGAEPGMICYAPDNKADNVFCSWNYYEGMNPIGIVCDGSNQSKVKVLELGRSNAYVYGPNEHKTSFCEDETYDKKVGKLWIAGGFNATYNMTDGIDWWLLVKENDYYKENNTSNSIWAYLTAKNKNSAVTWWVPARHEWQFVCWNWESMDHGFKTLGVGNGMAVGELFYVSTPNWYNNRCNLVGVGTDDGGKLNEYLALGSWMQMWTTSWKQDKYYRGTDYGAYVRAMAFVNME